MRGHVELFLYILSKQESMSIGEKWKSDIKTIWREFLKLFQVEEVHTFKPVFK